MSSLCLCASVCNAATLRAMKWRLVLTLLFTAPLVHAAGNDVLPSGNPEDVGLSSARLGRLAQVVRGEIDRGQMPGGFGFGLGVVRRETGIAGVPGTPGEFLWSGAQGTMFWVDPKEELTVVYLANTPGPIRRHYRELIKTLVLQSIAD